MSNRGTHFGPEISRRRALHLAGLAAGGLAIPRWALALAEQDVAAPAPMPPNEALRRLMQGNQRWASGQAVRPNQGMERRAELVAGQRPFAVVFSCVDSRVPPELIFDQGLGDLLVVRTAGHVIDDAALGSIEFGMEELHISLLLVLGHESCGAVSAAIEALEHHLSVPGRITTVVEGIRPAVERTAGDPGDRVDNAVRTNTQITVDFLRGAQPILSELRAEGKVLIVGGRYDLQSGLVEILF